MEIDTSEALASTSRILRKRAVAKKGDWVLIDESELSPIQRAAIFPSLLPQSHDLIVRRANDTDDLTQSILFEDHPRNRELYRIEKKKQRELKAKLARYKRLLSKTEYDRVVKRFSRPMRILVWDGSYRVQKATATAFGTRTYRRSKWVSKLEFIYLLHDSSKSAKTRQSLGKVIQYLLKHPEANVPQYTQYFINDKVLIVNAEAVNISHVKPNMIRKDIIWHDWKAIREYWAKRRSDYSPKIEALQEELERVQDAIQELLRCSSQRHSNRMLQICRCEALPMVNPKELNFSAEIIGGAAGMPGSWTWFDPDVDMLPSMIDGNGEHNWNIWNSMRRKPGAPNMGTNELLALCASSCVVGRYKVPDTTSESEEDEDHPAYTYADNDVQFYGIMSSLATRYIPTQRMINIVRWIDDEEFNESIVEDKLHLSLAKLLALDVGDSQLEKSFNLARSFAELKDTPQTARTFKDAIHSYQAWKTKSFWEARTRRSSRFFASPGAVGTFSKVRKLGVKSSTPIAVACSLYLAWKFGISQTLQDGATVMSQGWAWANGVRRGLGRLLQKLDPSRSFITLRRMFVHCASVVSKGRKLKALTFWTYDTDKPISYTDTLDLSRVYDRVFNIGLPFDDPMEYVIEGDKTKFWYIHPSVPGGILVDLLETVDKHNSAILADVFQGRNYNYMVYAARRVRGCVYARYAVDVLKRSLVRAYRSLCTRTRLWTTAWDLMPLSFVLEWFASFRDLVESAQAMLDRTVLKANPIGKPWVVLSGRLLTGIRRIEPNITTHIDSFKYGTIAWGDGQSIQGGEGAVETIRVVTQMKVHWSSARLESRLIDLIPSSIRRAVRMPWKESNRLPSLRLRSNLNVGKLGSLLAMFGSAK